MNNDPLISQFDEWLKDDSDYAAIVLRQWLEPVEGKDAVIFPPTYAMPKDQKNEWCGYNIDRLKDGSNVCQIDSVGSQANRMEPLFKKEPYSKLIPKVIIKFEDREINLLDAAHRASDAIVRYSTLNDELEEAFNSIKNTGNAESLAKIAPTSVVFGSWDSRSTQVKLPRIVRSVIRAYDTDMLHRSAQYTTIAGEFFENEEKDKDKIPEVKKADLGLAHVPAAWTHGGVIVKNEIRRDAALNLVVIRSLNAETDEKTIALRRYILGLALICFTAPQETFLREGCQLIPDQAKKAEWETVKVDGNRESFSMDHTKIAIPFAELAADEFGVGDDKEADFDKKAAQKALKEKSNKK